MAGQSGDYVDAIAAGERVQAFVPHPLGSRLPIAHDDIVTQLERANQAVGRLDGLSTVLPDSALFIFFYVRKEAVLSSQIEGTQSSLAELLLFEDDPTSSVPLDDVTEVSNYVAALDHGLERVRSGFPLANRLMREMHEILLRSGRGVGKGPGEFRREQVWIGGSRPSRAIYVPPPWQQVEPCMADLERYLNDPPPRQPILVRAALAHVQFETIHPFLDGNGRLGRLLVTLMLCSEAVLREPLLYLSLYFKEHRSDYYRLLQDVRGRGGWREWIEFFLEAVAVTAEQAATTARRILSRFAQDRTLIQRTTGNATSSMLRVHELMQRHPLLRVPDAAKRLELSAPTVRTAVQGLEAVGLVREITGRKRDRLYAYQPYLDILSEGTEPLPR